MQYTLYILFSENLNRYYIGYTGVLISVRLTEHLSNHKGFTAKVKDWQLVYTETYDTKKDAMLRENQLKRWKSRDRISQLIARSSIE